MNFKNTCLKKYLVFIVFIFLIFINFNQSIASSTIKKSLIINSRSNTLYVGGSGQGNYTKIQDAIYNASSGDTIFVYDDNSPYVENVRIFKSINLIGENKNTTIIDGGGWGNVFHVISDGVNIKGFTITNGRYGLIISSIYNSITNNIITNNLEGISLSKSKNHIGENYIQNNVYAINLEDSENNTIIENIIVDNVGGLFIIDCKLNIINNNRIHRNKGGIIQLGSDNITIINNKIYSNNYGIYFKKSRDNEIIGNNITSNNQYGIFLYNSSFNKIILNNNISYNIRGIRLRNNCSHNIIYQNNFLNNTHNAIDECNNTWDNGKYGNYWSDYKEKYPEAEKKPMKPWMWNIPYEIDSGNNIDNCPLIKQWYNLDISNNFQEFNQDCNQYFFEILR